MLGVCVFFYMLDEVYTCVAVVLSTVVNVTAPESKKNLQHSCNAFEITVLLRKKATFLMRKIHQDVVVFFINSFSLAIHHHKLK